MNVNAVKQVASKGFGRGLIVTKKYSPQILTGIGIVGVVTSAVFASKATLKLEPVIDKVNAGKDIARTRRGDEGYTERDYTKDLTHVYMHGTIDIVKLYGPAVTLGLSSIACIVGGQGIMHKRNVALAAAYKGLETSFSEYRKRVVEELGLDKERDIRYGMRDEVVKDEETGKDKTVTHIDPNGLSVYAKFFDELNSNWRKTPEYNLLFLNCQQNYANDLLHARGHIFLNEVYDMLGMEHTQAGAVVGWVLAKDGSGDNFVDFGIYDLDSDMAREFVNGYEKAILLDFNVNGIIYDRI